MNSYRAKASFVSITCFQELATISKFLLYIYTHIKGVSNCKTKLMFYVLKCPLLLKDFFPFMYIQDRRATVGVYLTTYHSTCSFAPSLILNVSLRFDINIAIKMNLEVILQKHFKQKTMT